MRDDVADLDAARRADLDGRWPTEARAEADVDRSVGDVAHGEIRDGDVFHEPSVHFLEREAAAIFKHAVRDREVAEAAVGLRAELDAAGAAAVVADFALACAVEERAFVVAAHLAVGDGDVFRRAHVSERKRSLRADAVVVGRIDGAVGDADVLAAVEVDAVAVRVDLKTVARPVIDAGGEDREVAAVINGEVAEDDVAAILERDGLVADAGGQRVVAGIAERAAFQRSVGRADAIKAAITDYLNKQ